MKSCRECKYRTDPGRDSCLYDGYCEKYGSLYDDDDLWKKCVIDDIKKKITEEELSFIINLIKKSAQIKESIIFEDIPELNGDIK